MGIAIGKCLVAIQAQKLRIKLTGDRRYVLHSDMPLENLAEEALKEAVAEVIAEHKLAGYPLAVWKDGRVVHLSPEQIEERERPPKYKASPKK